jgi:hypothetical protein
LRFKASPSDSRAGVDSSLEAESPVMHHDCRGNIPIEISTTVTAAPTIGKRLDDGFGRTPGHS